MEPEREFLWRTRVWSRGRRARVSGMGPLRVALPRARRERKERLPTRGDCSLEGDVVEVEHCDPVVPSAAGDSNPAAEGGVGGPVGGQNAQWIGDVSLEGQQRFEVGEVTVGARVC
ncbi:uncharacterized protein A4U43_C07F17740 [Asparagus officinalis]|uniref:Uncharacterized protein n=1 Tax=Asparagus officinalis TaxID=4686 RepID=A0A5P1ECR7_ASPOF|nr:uncharacterized protein A4U43_C07F17740 [Asparagus officinalis]